MTAALGGRGGAHKVRHIEVARDGVVGDDNEVDVGFAPDWPEERISCQRCGLVGQHARRRFELCSYDETMTHGRLKRDGRWDRLREICDRRSATIRLQDQAPDSHRALAPSRRSQRCSPRQ